jgi:hypothetical protein
MTGTTFPQAKPKQIQWAVVLLWLTFLLTAISILVSAQQSYSDDAVQNELTMLGTLVIILAFSIPKLAAGRNWARTTVVLCAVAVVALDVTNFQEILSEGSLMAMPELISDICLAAATYLVITEPGSMWFTRHGK